MPDGLLPCHALPHPGSRFAGHCHWWPQMRRTCHPRQSSRQLMAPHWRTSKVDIFCAKYYKPFRVQVCDLRWPSSSPEHILPCYPAVTSSAVGEVGLVYIFTICLCSISTRRIQWPLKSVGRRGMTGTENRPNAIRFPELYDP